MYLIGIDISKYKHNCFIATETGMLVWEFISDSNFIYLEFNPYLTSKYSKFLSLRETKTDKIDARIISNMLGSVDYKTLHTQFYHINELKFLVRERDHIITNRSKVLIKLTNVLDTTFP